MVAVAMFRENLPEKTAGLVEDVEPTPFEPRCGQQQAQGVSACSLTSQTIEPTLVTARLSHEAPSCGLALSTHKARKRISDGDASRQPQAGHFRPGLDQVLASFLAPGEAFLSLASLKCTI